VLDIGRILILSSRPTAVRSLARSPRSDHTSLMAPTGTVVAFTHADVCGFPGPIAARVGVVCGLCLAGTVAALYYTMRYSTVAAPPKHLLRFEPEPANNLDTAKCHSPAASTPTKRTRECSS
ncbi:hypothetical protein PENTCL1PPCAC_10108, partial [Pristionchus entomophagus]